MAEITKITSPLIPRENVGNKNRPVTEQSFELNRPDKVNRAPDDSRIRDREAGGHPLRENMGNQMVQALLRDSGELMGNVQKMLALMQMGISTTDVLQDAHIRDLINQIFANPEELMQMLTQQDEAAVLFKGQSFDVLRDILNRFGDNPRVRDAIVQVLKAFEHGVNSQNSIKAIVYNCSNLLDYMFSKDRAQFASYLDGLREVVLPAEAPPSPLADEDGTPPGQMTPEESRQEGQPSRGEAPQSPSEGEAPQASANPEALPRDARPDQAAGQPPETEKTAQTPEPKEPTQALEPKETAQVLKSNLLPLLGEVVVKYHQNEKIRDIVMAVVHNIVRVDKGTPEALREAVNTLVGELRKVANLPEGFEKNLLNALERSGEQVKAVPNDVVSRLAEVISETLRSPDSSAPALRQAENLLLSLLQNQNSMMNVLHFVLPLQTQDDRIFAEVYVDPDSDEQKGGRSGERVRKIFLTAESESHGPFELCFWESGQRVDFSMWCPQALVSPLNNLRRVVGELMQMHGYTMNSFHVEELTRPQSIAEAFPKLLQRKVGINVRV